MRLTGTERSFYKHIHVLLRSPILYTLECQGEREEGALRIKHIERLEAGIKVF